MSDTIYCQLVFKSHSIVSKHKLYYLYDRGNSATFFYSDIEKCWLVTVNNGFIKVGDKLLASSGENTHIINSKTDISFGSDTFSFFNCAESKGMVKILVDYLLKAKDNKTKIEKVLNMIQTNCGSYKDFYFVLDCLRRTPIFGYRYGELSLNIEILFKLIDMKENPSKSIVEYELGNGIQARELGKSFNINKIWKDGEFGVTAGRMPCCMDNKWSDWQVYGSMASARKNRQKLFHSSKSASMGYRKEPVPVVTKRSSKYVNPYVVRSSTEDFQSDDILASGDTMSLSNSKRLKSDNFCKSISYGRMYDSGEVSSVLTSTNSSHGRSSSIIMANGNSMNLSVAECFSSSSSNTMPKYLNSSPKCFSSAYHRVDSCLGAYKYGSCAGSRIIKYSKQARKINYKSEVSDSGEISRKLQLKDERDGHNTRRTNGRAAAEEDSSNNRTVSEEDSSDDEYTSSSISHNNNVVKRKASYVFTNKRYKHSFEVNLEPVVEEICSPNSIEPQNPGFQSDNELERSCKKKILKCLRSASTIEDGFLCERYCQVNHDIKKRNRLIKSISKSGNCKVKRL